MQSIEADSVDRLNQAPNQSLFTELKTQENKHN